MPRASTPGVVSLRISLQSHCVLCKLFSFWAGVFGEWWLKTRHSSVWGEQRPHPAVSTAETAALPAQLAHVFHVLWSLTSLTCPLSDWGQHETLKPQSRPGTLVLVSS